ncbi:YlzJ-like family protein [Virgibacillus sp. W0181]|uniref:YlzJ-like family protein n=1 Tax=Virgibacillus sp. W0181 TaxID=3391581 RepID=UPI003F470A32
MILYTPLCESDIFPNDKVDNREFISYQGKTVLAERNNEGSYQMLQLLSTDPQDFLNENYVPGTILSTEYIGK